MGIMILIDVINISKFNTKTDLLTASSIHFPLVSYGDFGIHGAHRVVMNLYIFMHTISF